jgi:hypothetical protein
MPAPLWLHVRLAFGPSRRVTSIADHGIRGANVGQGGCVSPELPVPKLDVDHHRPKLSVVARPRNHLYRRSRSSLERGFFAAWLLRTHRWLGICWRSGSECRSRCDQGHTSS